MDDAVVVRGFESLRDLRTNRDRLVYRKPVRLRGRGMIGSSRQHVGQRFPFDELHHQRWRNTAVRQLEVFDAVKCLQCADD